MTTSERTFTNDEVNAFIIETKNKNPHLSFARLAHVVNIHFQTTVFTRNAVMARYNRHGLGRKYENMPGGLGLRVARAKRLPHPREGIEKPRSTRRRGATQVYSARKKTPEEIAEAEVVAQKVRELAKGNLFTLQPGQHYLTIFELRNNTCRWPLEAADGRTFYCGTVESNIDCDCKRPYCRVHTRIAESKWHLPQL